MKCNTIDLLVYVGREQQAERLGVLARKLVQLGGVIKANVNPYVRGLLDVEYDPMQLSGSELVNYVKQDGCAAVLVGM
jgi:hypothetical protein